MMYAVKITSGGMVYIPGSMTFGSGIQEILRMLPQQYERL
jgi:hypothetical protein